MRTLKLGMDLDILATIDHDGHSGNLQFEGLEGNTETSGYVGGYVDGLDSSDLRAIALALLQVADEVEQLECDRRAQAVARHHDRSDARLRRIMNTIRGSKAKDIAALSHELDSDLPWLVSGD